MAVAIPFVKEMAFDYGVVQQVSPLVRRVVARNPSPFTYHGTGTYIVGRGAVAVIDPGPELPPGMSTPCSPRSTARRSPTS